MYLKLSFLYFCKEITKIAYYAKNVLLKYSYEKFFFPPEFKK